MIVGGRKKSKKQKPAYIAPDTARSKSFAKILIALGEGEVTGSSNGLLSARDIYLDGVPIENDNGSRNYNVKWEFRNGTLDQDYIPALPVVESDTAVGFALKATSPWVRSITNNQVDKIRVRLSWQQLVNNKSNGDRVGVTVVYAIDLAVGAGAFEEIQRHRLSEKSTSKYERSHSFDLPRSDAGWRIRVRRLTPDSDTDMVQDAMVLDAFTEIIDAKLTYPNTALLYLEFDAEQFPQTPKVAVELKGKVVRVPENYNPTTRQYAGVWDGRFKWSYTNNPAWCALDLVISERYGLGERITLGQVDKWALYEIAKWCDVMVPDGEGGEQPRHTMNVYISTLQDAWRVLGDIASIFNGVTCWNGQQLEVQADFTRDSDFVFSRANVVDGKFEYGSIPKKEKYSQVTVKYDNPDNEYETDTVAVNDIDLTRRFGVVQTETGAFGCTARGEAQRKGKWALMSNRFDRTVIFKTGLDGYLPKIGRVITIADNMLAGAPIGGRISAFDVDTGVKLDRAPRAKTGDTITVNMPDGKAQSRTIAAVVGNVVTVATPFNGEPVAGLQWSIDSSDLAVQQFKITSLKQDSQVQFTVQAVEYNHSKFDYVDNGAEFDERPITITPVTEQPAPTNLRLNQYNYTEQGLSITNVRFEWDAAEGAVYYELEWRKDRMTWINVAQTSLLGVDIEGVYSGVYEFRVRAVNVMGVPSESVMSAPLAVTGKTGAPPALAYLRTVSKVMGIQLEWGFPAEGAGDAALVEIQYSLAPDDTNAQLLGEYSYPTDNHTLMGLGNATELYFKGRIIDRTGNIGPWTAWVYGASSASSDEILSYIDGKIGLTQLDEFLRADVAGISTIAQSQIDTDGKLATLWGVRMSQAADGKWVTAGIGLGIEDVNGVTQSQFIVQADLFAVRQGLEGSQQTVFAVEDGQTILRSALIGDATITMLKIAGDLYSTNYVAGVSGWKLSRGGELEFNATVEGQGRIRLNSDGLYVYDAVNEFPRVKMGNLSV